VHVAGRLRGCIGRIETASPLVETVAELAVSAATRDPRFAPLSADELPAARLEISVLSPRARMDDPAALTVGRHGLLITRGARRGLLLPQVAEEHGWDAPTFLDETCRKAGLDAGAWRAHDVTVETFTAQVFSED
jgi:AmmeMemoRadiSam system protein A